LQVARRLAVKGDQTEMAPEQQRRQTQLVEVKPDRATSQCFTVSKPNSATALPLFIAAFAASPSTS